ncbi:hypothetical protein FB45DRAFT_511545 [Roridomyces roridus]|uniref:Apoptogenic protein 1, mitochondrial n=1 Tax=Roridomyces roridus TaxID=1738132 RepID=A0AAD7BWR0_9AGAR|nr:hypothetical protein FB45DRAFT_511545 [Roridomyces roridus]
MSLQRGLGARALHVSRALCDRVAPPHPVSNMRPIIYDQDEPTTTTRAYHPYSLHEFEPTPTNPYKLQWKLQRQQLDDFHHDFWLESNTRFEHGKHEALSRLPETATALDKERALSEFYGQWVREEKRRTDEYTEEWRQRNKASLNLAFRVAYQDLASRFSDIALFKNNKKSA